MNTATSSRPLSAKSANYRLTAKCLAALVGSFMATTALADAPNVVTSIKPIHSIASAVMEGVGQPHILVDGAASPHGFALKPSQAFVLQGADAVFWVGPELAPSLEKPINSMASDAVRVELLNSTGIHHLGLREGANFDAHDHDHGDHGHDDHAEHDHDDHKHEEHAEHDHDDHKHEEHAEHDHDDHKHEEHAEHDHDDHKHEEHAEHDHDDDKHEEHAGHDHEGERDAHIWLNPENGIAIANVIADTLSKIDPEHADTYQNNAKKFAATIEKLDGELAEQMHAAEGKKFIVFHDAYHHFEHHYDVEASGAITVSPEALASADRISEIQHRIQDLNVTCVFQEPQFDSKLVSVAIEGSKAHVGTLDPLGTEIANGPGLYPELLSNLAKSITECLAKSS